MADLILETHSASFLQTGGTRGESRCEGADTWPRAYIRGNNHLTQTSSSACSPAAGCLLTSSVLSLDGALHKTSVCACKWARASVSVFQARSFSARGQRPLWVEHLRRSRAALDASIGLSSGEERGFVFSEPASGPHLHARLLCDLESALSVLAQLLTWKTTRGEDPTGEALLIKLDETLISLVVDILLLTRAAEN